MNAAFRHPAVLAHDATTLDLLSDGRLELGLGAGYMKSEYELVGISHEAPATRNERLFESVRVIKTLLTGDSASFSGRHSRVSGLPRLVRPMQRPYPPILVGGGGRALLRFAAREADIVSVVPRSTPEGLDPGDFGWASFEEKLSWVRSAAADRPGSPELNTLVQTVKVSGDRVAAGRELAKEWSVDEELVLDSPLCPDRDSGGDRKRCSEYAGAARCVLHQRVRGSTGSVRRDLRACPGPREGRGVRLATRVCGAIRFRETPRSSHRHERHHH